MRIRTVLILIALSVSIISPLSAHISVSSNGTFLITLDVCIAAGCALSVNQYLPCLYEYQFEFPVLEITDLFDNSNPAFKPLLIAFQMDRPPRV